MQKLTEIELKRVQLDILKQVAAFCDEKGIEYFLFYGTLIGTVRHKGFIPWDDDIDICMRRKDYDRFFKEFNAPNLSAVNIDNNSEYYLASGKVIDNRTVLIEHADNSCAIGVNIDVFPLDSFPGDFEIITVTKLLSPWKNILLLKLVKISKARSVIKNLVLAVGKLLTLLFPMRFVLRKIDSLARRYENHPNCIKLCDIAGFGLTPLDDSWFSGYVEMEFENHHFKVPVEYDKALRSTYGDYMKLPPVEERVTHHAFDAYWK